MIISVGTAYTGFDRWLLACDVRYFDYADAAGLAIRRASMPRARGRVLAGGAWHPSPFTGAGYQATKRLFLRFGYEYNDNPIGSDEAFFNIESPLIVQHIVWTGLTYNLTDQLSSLAYLHGLNTASGPIQTPGVGPLPGTSVTSQVSADAFAAGLTVHY